MPNNSDFLTGHNNEFQVVGCPLCLYIKFKYPVERLTAGGEGLLFFPRPVQRGERIPFSPCWQYIN